MTAADFRSIALSFPETLEHEHMHHPDFRVRGKIFATLGYPDGAYGMVKLTPEQQHDYIKSEPDVFAPSKGAWGRAGSTIVKLKAAKKNSLRSAMAAAWGNISLKTKAAPRKRSNAL
jgi:YjbR